MNAGTPISWELLWAALRRIVPGLDRPTVMGILDRLFVLKWTPDWEFVRDWEGLDDVVILDRLLSGLPLPNDSVAMVSANHSQFKSEPYSMCLSDLRPFVAEHQRNFGECFFNGDTLIAIPDACIVLGLQHDGYPIRYPAQGEYPLW